MRSVTVGLLILVVLILAVVLTLGGCSKPHGGGYTSIPSSTAKQKDEVPAGSCVGTWEADTIAGKFRLKIEPESTGTFGLVPNMMYKIRWWSMPDGFGGKVYVEERGKTTEYRISGVPSRDRSAIRLKGYGDGGFGENQEMDFKRSQFD